MDFWLGIGNVLMFFLVFYGDLFFVILEKVIKFFKYFIIIEKGSDFNFIYGVWFNYSLWVLLENCKIFCDCDCDEV